MTSALGIIHPLQTPKHALSYVRAVSFSPTPATGILWVVLVVQHYRLPRGRLVPRRKRQAGAVGAAAGDVRHRMESGLQRGLAVPVYALHRRERWSRAGDHLSLPEGIYELFFFYMIKTQSYNIGQNVTFALAQESVIHECVVVCTT